MRSAHASGSISSLLRGMLRCHIPFNNKGDMKMTRPNTRSHRSLRSTFASIVDVFAGATECAAAAEGGRRPSNRALTSVGIDPARWDSIGRHG
jgi:hypothetical protein